MLISLTEFQKLTLEYKLFETDWWLSKATIKSIHKDVTKPIDVEFYMRVSCNLSEIIVKRTITKHLLINNVKFDDSIFVYPVNFQCYPPDYSKPRPYHQGFIRFDRKWWVNIKPDCTLDLKKVIFDKNNQFYHLQLHSYFMSRLHPKFCESLLLKESTNAISKTHDVCELLSKACATWGPTSHDDE